jgi:Holliday junction DNA helicase RuvB
LDISEESLENIAKKSRGTPRIANRLLKIMRDYITIGKDISNVDNLKEIFDDIGIDEL